MKTQLGALTIATDATLRDALAAMDESGEGVVLVVDPDAVMQGLLTDGDVRRVLLKGGQVGDPVVRHMNRHYVSGRLPKNRPENIALINDEISKLPILNRRGQAVDLLRLADLWRLPVMEPVLKGREVEYVLDCLTTNWISSQGKYVTRFESAFCDDASAGHALSVSNGTAALHLAMAALGIGPGDEVIVPDLTFAAPASMTLLCGARPVLVDVDRDTWTIDPRQIEARITPRTRAIVPVHLYGHPCDMDPIMEIAGRHGLHVIEDCAEALGAEYKGQRVGTIGDVGTFSFFANKVITTGEGGMVTTRNLELHQRMQMLRDHGMSKERRYWHQAAGFNYRMTNLQAAIGVAQLENIDAIQAYRRKIVARYTEQLSDIDGLILPPCQPWAKNICWLYSILVDARVVSNGSQALMSQLGDQGIETRPFFHPLHLQPPFAAGNRHDFPNARWLADSGLSLPTSNKITMADVDKVCSAIRTIISDEELRPCRQGRAG